MANMIIIQSDYQDRKLYHNSNTAFKTKHSINLIQSKSWQVFGARLAGHLDIITLFMLYLPDYQEKLN